MTYDATEDRLLVADPTAAAVVAIDRATGARTVLSSNEKPDSTAPFEYIHDIALDSVAPTIYSIEVDAAGNRLVAVHSQRPTTA